MSSNKVEALSTELSELLQKNNDLLSSVVTQVESIKTKLDKDNVSVNLDKSTVEALDQKKTKQIQDLEQKCMDLSKDNEDLNKTLELVMQKFRQLQNSIADEKAAVRRSMEKQLEEERRTNEALRQENFMLQQKLHETLTVMREAVASDYEELDQRSLIEQLSKENEGLKELLAISDETALLSQ